jgi:hypothetical protein
MDASNIEQRTTTRSNAGESYKDDLRILHKHVALNVITG